MKILLTFDTGYAPHAATVMESIIQNCPEKLDFAVIYCDLNEETRTILSNHFQGKVSSLLFYEVDEQAMKKTIKDVRVAEHLTSLSTYLRLFAPTILKEDDHVVYLDCDVIVKENILNIVKNADLTKPLCAVTEYNPKYKFRNLMELSSREKSFVDSWIYEAYWCRAYKGLGLNEEVGYFNSGVMIVNLAYWREHGIGEKAIKFLIENPGKVFSADQDALNHVIGGNYFELAPQWNTIVAESGVFTNYTREELEQAYSNPKIMHFAGPIKPWHYATHPAICKLYMKYRSLTPWPQLKYDDVKLKQRLKRYVYYPCIILIKNCLVMLLGKSRGDLVASLFKSNKADNSFYAHARLR